MVQYTRTKLIVALLGLTACVSEPTQPEPTVREFVRYPDCVGPATRRCVVLGLDEHKAAAERQDRRREQATRSARARRKSPAAFVVLWWLSVLTMIVGAILPGLAMATAVAVGWLLWRFLPELGDMVEAASDLSDDVDDPDRRDGRRDRTSPRKESQ